MDRLTWFKRAGYGLFVHFGLYSMLGGVYKGKPSPRNAEWIMRHLQIPVAEYKKLNRQDYRMYLNISHENAPEKIRLNEMVQFQKGKPELEIGEELSVYWIPGKKTAMRVAQPRDAVVSMLIGLVLTFIGFAISDAVQN